MPQIRRGLQFFSRIQNLHQSRNLESKASLKYLGMDMSERQSEIVPFIVFYFIFLSDQTVCLTKIPSLKSAIFPILQLDIQRLESHTHHNRSLEILVHNEAADDVIHPGCGAEPIAVHRVIIGPPHFWKGKVFTTGLGARRYPLYVRLEISMRVKQITRFQFANYPNQLVKVDLKLRRVRNIMSL